MARFKPRIVAFPAAENAPPVLWHFSSQLNILLNFVIFQMFGRGEQFSVRNVFKASWSRIALRWENKGENVLSKKVSLPSKT